MPYVRLRGNQVLIVHGEREPGTGKVEQRILFTLYSQAEAREAVGNGAGNFEHLIETAHPDLRFDWKRIHREISRLAPSLPESYDYDTARQRGRFRHALCGFARELMLTDPQVLTSSARLVEESRTELEYLGQLLRFRLDTCGREENEWNRDNPFHWLSSIRGKELPVEIEEELAHFFERGETDRAEKLFRFAVECFPGYAEGHNYLGLIALDRGRLDEAIASFEKTVELGRKLFPRRIARAQYWTNLETRPYIRGLRNLALALERAGRWDESLAVCDRLESECGDRVSALATRSAVWIKTGRFAEAAGAGQALLDLGVGIAFVLAIAQHALDQPRASLASFLHGALNRPRTARMLAGKGTKRVAGRADAEGHNTGVDLLRSFGSFLEGPGRDTRRFFARALAEPGFAALLDEQAELERRNDVERAKRLPPPSETFRLLSKRRELAFARERATAIADVMGLPPERPVLTNRPARGRRVQ
jgi:tetratricopeptide (TPR) repeat protein